MNVTLICDPFRRIIACVAGAEGSVHDSRIVEKMQLEKLVADGHFIIFDDGASLSHKCLKP